MHMSDPYKSIFLEPDWVHQKYYGWKVFADQNCLRVLKKIVGPVDRFLVLSQLNHEDLEVELAKLAIFSQLAVVTIKDFSVPNQLACVELKIGNRRLAKVDDAERLLNKHTFVIDLTQGNDQLWSNMNSHTRRLCQKALAAGMRVECDTSPSDTLITLFFERYKKMANERSLDIPDEKIIRRMFEDGCLSLYYARNENEIFSMVLMYSAGLTSFFLYGVSGEQKNDGSGQYLHWKAIESLQLASKHWYDLGGVAEISDTNGIYRFKKGLGGKLVDLGAEYYYCPVVLTVARRVYKKLRAML